MWTGRPSASDRRARSGKPRHPGMLSGDTGLAATGHRPPATRRRTTTSSPRRTSSTASSRAANTASPSPLGGVGRADRATQLALGGHDARRELRAADVHGEHTVHGREPTDRASLRWTRRPTDRVSAYPVPAAPRLEEHPLATRRDRRPRHLRRPPRRGPRQHRAGHPGQARGDRARAPLPRVRGPPAHRGRARRGQDQPRQGAGRVDRRHLRPHPVHARPAAHRRGRRHRVEPQRQRVRVPARPVFGNIVLADEINRASPKTQSALLEAMAETQVTVDGTTYQLASPFMVIATQNPIEHEGTYPLPESQLDRFLMRISVGYPATDKELEILDTHGDHDAFDDISCGDHQPRRAGHGRHRQGRARGAGAEGVPRRPRQRVTPPPAPRARHVAARHARPAARRPRAGGRQRPQLRRARRPQGARRAGARPPAPRHARGPAPGHHRRRRPHRGAAGRPRPGRQDR